VLVHRRARIHLGVVGALVLIAILYVALPQREVTVAADGTETTVVTRADSDGVLLRLADVELLPGDRTVRVERGGDDVLEVDRATPVVVEVDGQLLALRTHSETIAGALEEAGVRLGPKDSVLQNDVFVSPYDPVRPLPRLATLLLLKSEDASSGASADAQGEPVSIEVRRAVPFTVIEDGQTLVLESSRTTVGLALKEAEVQLGPGDRVLPTADAELSAGLEVHVRHATPLTVTLPDSKLVLYTLADTVGEALEEAGIEVPEDSRLEPGPEKPVTDGLSVHVIRMFEDLQLEQEYIESQTVYEADPSLSPGETERVEGHDGVHYRQYHVVYENEVPVAWELVAEWYDPEPQDTVVYYSPARESAPSEIGAAVEPSAPPEGYEVVRTMRVYATWYCPASAGRSPADSWYGMTATGVPVAYGVVAVDPNVIPLGTSMYIPGYGFGVAADTGGGVIGNMIDLGYPDCYSSNWMSHWVEIQILAP
jgi:uncharacterized protein YabE (DUF348 family)/3D (Asp-Asp-Asp) domain-containing protein